MTKKEIIKELVIAWMQSYEVGSKERYRIYYKQDYINNLIDRINYKCGIDWALKMFRKNESIYKIMDYLLGAINYEKIVYGA